MAINLLKVKFSFIQATLHLLMFGAIGLFIFHLYYELPVNIILGLLLEFPFFITGGGFSIVVFNSSGLSNLAIATTLFFSLFLITTLSYSIRNKSKYLYLFSIVSWVLIGM